MANDSVVDERTFREIYTTGFEIAIKEGKSKSIMSSYNEVNGVYANENSHMLQEILVDEWGFDGFVVSDWGGSNDHALGVKLKAAAEHGITVVRVPAYSPYAVAEHAVALMLSLNRKVHRAYWRTRDGNFALHGLLGFDMHGKTAGIVGTGKIARALIRILRGFGMEVLGYDPCPDEAFARESGMTYVPLTELYRRSDIISLHCPLTDRTLHMIDAEAIGQMKDGVIIINTGRGQLIRTSDLIEGLKEKKIGAAGLDVYEEEADYFYQDTSDRIMDDDMLARLLSFNNVILTSHQGFFTREALDNIARTTLENIQAFSHGECLNEVKYK